jgi:hypothetical protein
MAGPGDVEEEPGMRTSSARDHGHDEVLDARAQAWEALRGCQDRDRYLAPLTENAGALLAPPASTLRTAASTPDAVALAAYLERSCDLTMRGGAAAAVTYPLAACALAEHYLVRRIGGSGTAALAAAAVAAAEVGRAAAPPAADAPALVAPGYAGLAEAVGWLAGDDQDGDAGSGNRAARLLQPSGPMRAPFRLVAAVAAPRHRGLAMAAALAGVPGRGARVAVALVWAGVVLAAAGFTVALLRSPTVAPWVVAVLAPVLVVTVLLAGAAAHLLGAVLGLRGLLEETAGAEQYGLVPGVPLADGGRPPGRVSELLDRLTGVPAADGVPPLLTWATDVLDDLAGMPPEQPGLLDDAGVRLDSPTQQSRRALTFGDLWLRRAGRAEGDAELLRRSAADPELRAVDLRLIATDVTTGRPVELPLAEGWWFCGPCLAGGLPSRVVEQLTAAAPAADDGSDAHAPVCPRHGSPLLPMPTAADMPVIVAARLAAATPGLMRATPLYRVTHGDRITAHWFCDAGAADADVTMFDAPLPRWPTFGLAVVPVAADDAADGDWVEVPESDTSPGPDLAAPLGGPWAYARAVLAARSGWRDRTEFGRQGSRGRLGVVRRGSVSAGGLAPDAAEVLRLALRGHHAGRELRARFTGRDGDIASQTGTDRYRWVRLRTALRGHRDLSLAVSARLPLYTDLAVGYRIPAAVAEWFTPPIAPGRVDPAWADAAAALTHVKALTDGGVLDWDTDYGTPPR